MSRSRGGASPFLFLLSKLAALVGPVYVSVSYHHEQPTPLTVPFDHYWALSVTSLSF